MSYRFTLAAVTAAITLTGCAKPQSAVTPEDFFAGPTQINVSHIITRADDGSSIFLTVDGNEAGPLVAGQNTALHIPAGKHKVGGYAQTLLGLGRVTIDPVEVTTATGEVTQIAYSVTRAKPVFVNEGVTKLPAKPAPAPAPEPVKPPEDDQTAATDQTPVAAEDAQQKATSATPAVVKTQITPDAQPAAATTQSTATDRAAATTTSTTQSTAADRAAATTTGTTQSTAADRAAATTTGTAQSTATDRAAAATTGTTQSTAADQAAAATTGTTQSTAADQAAATTDTTQSTTAE